MSSTSGMKRPAPPKGRIRVIFRAQDGDLQHFTVGPQVTCERLFKEYCEKKDLSYRSVEFLFDGTRIRKRSRTFEQMGFVDEVEIDVMEHMPGGGI